MAAFFLSTEVWSSAERITVDCKPEEPEITGAECFATSFIVVNADAIVGLSARILDTVSAFIRKVGAVANKVTSSDFCAVNAAES